jgi:hypothetical protein
MLVSLWQEWLSTSNQRAIPIFERNRDKLYSCFFRRRNKYLVLSYKKEERVSNPLAACLWIKTHLSKCLIP